MPPLEAPDEAAPELALAAQWMANDLSNDFSMGERQ
jgi:hypothetical protein